MDHNAIMDKYGVNMKMVGRVPDALADAMGNQMYVATFPTEEALWGFYKEILEDKDSK